MGSARPLQGAELLRHQGFVRRLARELVRDAALADDLAQEAWVRALERPPRVAGAARAWFRTVLRNLAGRAARERSRRDARELMAAREEALPGPLEVGDRLQLEQRLVQAVDALREPYRGTVFLRYFEDLSPRAIAASEGVPVATVKTRLRRGLEMLREELDRGGERRAWVLGLARLAASAPEGAGVPAGALAAAGLAAVATAAWVWQALASERGAWAPELAAEPAVMPRDESGEVALLAPEPAGAPERQALAPAEPAADPRTDGAEAARAEPRPAEPRVPGELLVLRGRVLFPDGSGAEGAGVALGAFATRTGPGGRFELVLDEENALLSVRGRSMRATGQSLEREDALVAWLDGWTPAVRADVGLLVEAARATTPPAELEPVELWLASRALEIRGTLLDRGGAPAAGWRFALLDGQLIAKGSYRPFTAEDMASDVSSHQETGADGRFAFRGLAPEKSYRVRAWNQRTLEQVVSEPIPAGTLDVVLRAPNDRWRPLVDGVVVGLDGTPLADVRCRLTMAEYAVDGGMWMTTGQEVTTDELGRFAFRDVPPAEIFVRFNGHGSGTQVDLPPDEPCSNLRVELARSGAFRLESSVRVAEAVAVLDEAGQRLRIEVSLGEGRTAGVRELELSAGACEGVVSELARWLVLLEDGREVERIPLVIRAGETALVRR